MQSPFLQSARGTLVVLFTLTAGVALNATFDHEADSAVMYVVFYGLAALFAVAIAATTVLIGQRKKGAAAMASDKGDEIHINTGDVTDSTIVGKVERIEIHAPPQAHAHGQLLAAQQKEGDNYLTRMAFNIDASYAARRLRIDAHGKSIVGFDFYEPPRDFGQGMTISGGNEEMVFIDVQPTHAWKQVDKPAPSYWVDVLTKQPETPRFRVTFP